MIPAAGVLIATEAIPVLKKCFEVAMPVIKHGSQICFKVIEGGLISLKDKKVEKYTLSGPLKIIDNGLSIPTSFSENQLIPLKSQVADELLVIKGQNEMLFLSNSIDYFVNSHKNRVGLDRSISYALQYDINAVREHLKKNREIRFPGYLLHQCASLAETIKDINVLYEAILQNGAVPTYTDQHVEAELRKCFGPDGSPPKFKSYIPYDRQLPFLKKIAEESKKKNSKMPFTLPPLFGGGVEEIEDKPHEALFILCEELLANEELEQKVAKKLQNVSENKIFIENGADE